MLFFVCHFHMMENDLHQVRVISKSSFGHQRWKAFLNIRKYRMMINICFDLWYIDRHNDSVRCLQYNPKSHQLLSCTQSDFGLWSPEQKSVTKTKVTNQINCCAWNEDGNLFALGFNSGVVSLRLKVQYSSLLIYLFVIN